MDNGASSYRRFLAGDEKGLEEIICDYKDGLILFINSIVGNVMLAEELTEDTFVKLVVNKPKFKEKSSFKSWLYAIGKNVAYDFLRKARHKAIPLTENLSALLYEEENLEREYIKNEQRAELLSALKRIKPDYRQILYLSYFEGFSNADAAEILKKSRRQIENLIYRAKNALKSELEKENFVYEELF